MSLLLQSHFSAKLTLNPDSNFFFKSNPTPKIVHFHTRISASFSPDSKPHPNTNPNPSFSQSSNTDQYPSTIPKKPKRGRPSEAAAVEDFIRNSLEKTFKSIREQNGEVFDGEDEILKEKTEVKDEDEKEGNGKKNYVVEEEDPDWPVDADVGWGVRASVYFENHAIKNVMVDGVEIDWEGEVDDGLVKEINCLEWESFAFHPSPMIVLVFERYNRAVDNWKVLKELEKAAKVYWNAKDRLPPRTVKIDINIETDLAYALKVRECPQLLFLKGNKILYREKEFRTSDELVHMIAHFYYNAKRPTWIDAAAVAPF